MKKTRLYKLVKQALLEVIRETKNPKLALKYSPEYERLSSKEKSGITNDLLKEQLKIARDNSPIGSANFSKEKIEKIYNFLVENSEEKIPLEKIINDPILKGIDPDGLSVIYLTISTITLEEFIELLPELVGMQVGVCDSYGGVRSFGAIDIYKSSVGSGCESETIDDSFICCSPNNQTISAPGGSLFTLVPAQGYSWDVDGGTACYLMPNNVSTFDFADFEDYFIGGGSNQGSGAGGGFGYLNQWPVAYHDGTTNSNGNTCFGCAHSGTLGYVTGKIGCNNGQNQADPNDLSCCDFQGCGATTPQQILPPADTNSINGVTATKPNVATKVATVTVLGTSYTLTAYADEEQPYFTDNGSCNWNVGCFQSIITLNGIDLNPINIAAGLPNPSPGYVTNSTNYSYQGQGGDSNYTIAQTSLNDDGSCIVEACADTSLAGITDPSGNTLTTTYVGMGPGTYSSPGNGVVVQNLQTLCEVQACQTQGAANWVDPNQFTPGTVVNDISPSLCVTNVTGCMTVGMFNYSISNTTPSTDCYFEGCVNNTQATNYVCTDYPQFCLNQAGGTCTPPTDDPTTCTPNPNLPEMAQGQGFTDDPGVCTGVNDCIDDGDVTGDPTTNQAWWDGTNAAGYDYATVTGIAQYSLVGPATNYDINNTTEIGNCQYNVDGCIGTIVGNDGVTYNIASLVTNPSSGTANTTIIEDGSCEVSACWNQPTAINYFCTVYPGLCNAAGSAIDTNLITSITDDGSCSNFQIPGCTDATACNPTPGANTDDGSCLYPGDPSPVPFIDIDPTYTCDCNGAITIPGDCDCYGNIMEACGCGIPIPVGDCDCNGNVDLGCGCTSTPPDDCGVCNGDNTSCEGCTNPNDNANPTNYDPLAVFTNGTPNDDGSCEFSYCMDAIINQNPTSNFICDQIPSLCTGVTTPGTGTPDTSLGTWSNVGCIQIVDGCMDDGSLLTANGDAFDSPYEFGILGAGNGQADNYSPLATTDSGTGTYGSCTYTQGCTDPGYIEFLGQGFIANQDNASSTNGAISTYCLTEIINGCTAPGADNYNPAATSDNNSCKFVGCIDDGNQYPAPPNNIAGGSPWTNYVCFLNSTQGYPDVTDQTYGSTTINQTKTVGEWLCGCVAGSGCSAISDPDTSINVLFSDISPIGTDPTMYDAFGIGNTGEVGSCIGLIGGPGCMNNNNQYYQQGISTTPVDVEPGNSNWNSTSAASNFTTEDGSCLYYGCNDPEALNYFCILNPTLCTNITANFNNPGGSVTTGVGCDTTAIVNASGVDSCLDNQFGELLPGNQASVPFNCEYDIGWECGNDKVLAPNTGGQNQFPYTGCVTSSLAGSAGASYASFADCQAACLPCTEVTAKKCNGSTIRNYTCDGQGGSDGLQIDGFDGDHTGSPGQVYQSTVTAPYFIGQRFKVKEKMRPAPNDVTPKQLEEQYDPADLTSTSLNDPSVYTPTPNPDPKPDVNVWGTLWVSYEVQTTIEKFSDKPRKQAEGTQCFATTYDCRCLSSPCPEGGLGATPGGGHKHYCTPNNSGTGQSATLGECLEWCPCEASGRYTPKYPWLMPSAKKVDSCPGHTGRDILPKSCDNAKYYPDKERPDIKEPVEPTTDKPINIDTVEPVDIDRPTEPTGSVDVPEKPTITPDTPELKESKKLRKLIKKWKRNNL